MLFRSTIAAETSAYERGVLEMETRLTAEVTAICREYCAETYNQALDRARIHADSDLRRIDQVYYLEDLRENPTPPPPPNEPFLAQKSSQNSKLPIRFEKEEQEKEKEKAKEKEKEKKKEQNKADANPYGSKSKIDSKKDSQQP